MGVVCAIIGEREIRIGFEWISLKVRDLCSGRIDLQELEWGMACGLDLCDSN
jgi:hypothetical protein